MKKNTIIALTASIALMMSACSSGNPANIEDTDLPPVEEQNVQADVVTVEEQLLVDEMGFKITANSLEDGYLGPELKILIENNTDKNIIVQTRNSSVNGYMIDASLSCDVAAGKKANATISFYETSLEACGIETIADMEFSLLIFDAETWDTYYESGLIQIDTSAKPDYSYSYDDSGELLYEGGGIRIISKGFGDDDNIMGPELRLFIENESGTDITVQSRDVSVNGFMIGALMSADVVNGKRAVDGLTFYRSSLEENGIEEISSVEFSLVVLDPDYNTVATTDIISMEF